MVSDHTHHHWAVILIFSSPNMRCRHHSAHCVHSFIYKSKSQDCRLMIKNLCNIFVLKNPFPTLIKSKIYHIVYTNLTSSSERHLTRIGYKDLQLLCYDKVSFDVTGPFVPWFIKFGKFHGIAKLADFISQFGYNHSTVKPI